jgi:hypothetical protein
MDKKGRWICHYNAGAIEHKDNLATSEDLLEVRTELR